MREIKFRAFDKFNKCIIDITDIDFKKKMANTRNIELKIKF